MDKIRLKNADKILEFCQISPPTTAKNFPLPAGPKYPSGNDFPCIREDINNFVVSFCTFFVF